MLLKYISPQFFSNSDAKYIYVQLRSIFLVDGLGVQFEAADLPWAKSFSKSVSAFTAGVNCPQALLDKFQSVRTRLEELDSSRPDPKKFGQKAVATALDLLSVTKTALSYDLFDAGARIAIRNLAGSIVSPLALALEIATVGDSAMVQARWELAQQLDDSTSPRLQKNPHLSSMWDEGLKDVMGKSRNLSRKTLRAIADFRELLLNLESHLIVTTSSAQSIVDKLTRINAALTRLKSTLDTGYVLSTVNSVAGEILAPLVIDALRPTATARPPAITRIPPGSTVTTNSPPPAPAPPEHEDPPHETPPER